VNPIHDDNRKSYCIIKFIDRRIYGINWRREAGINL